MRRVYDVFERFSDNSTLWRATVTGRFEADRRLRELAEHSENEFFLIEVPTEKFLPTVPAPKSTRPLTKITAAG